MTDLTTAAHIFGPEYCSFKIRMTELGITESGVTGTLDDVTIHPFIDGQN
jgi:hypothetical protein